MISKAEFDPTFIKRIITGDETWVYEYNTQSIRRVNGKLQMSQENHIVFSRKRKRCSQFSWITTVLYITNFCQKVRQLIRNIIWALWDVCVKQFAKKERICGQTTRGFCTMITHRRTVPSLSVNFWLRMKRIPFNSHRIHLIWLPAIFFCSIELKNHYGERVLTSERR